ncbi:MAG: DMT family protein [Phycisphaerales bacterium]
MSRRHALGILPLMIPRWLATTFLLVASNAFMTTAWYLHLKKQGWGLALAIGISWLIALPEYCLQVPANRLGHIDHGGPFTAPQLKILQEAITLVVFSIFAVLVLKERLRWNDLVAFGLVFAGVAVSVMGRR